MSFHIQEKSLDVARDDAISVLGATRKHAVDLARFEWLYRDNPDGEAVLWFAQACRTGKIAGFAGVLPRRMLVNDELKSCWNCADLSILPAFRRQGLAVLLRTQARTGVDHHRVDLLYGHPNPHAAGVHWKAGYSPVGDMVRYAKVLTTQSYLKQRIGSQVLAMVGAAVADPLLRMTGAESRHRAKCSTSLMESVHFDERFDRLFEEAAPRTGVIGVRDAKYLNWRYAENPLETPLVIVAENAGRLAGYLVLVIAEGVGQVKDLFPMDNRQVARDLLAKATHIGRKSGLRSLSMTILSNNPLLSVLTNFGFRKRSESSQMFSYATPASPLAGVVSDGAAWWITVGDRDV